MDDETKTVSEFTHTLEEFQGFRVVENSLWQPIESAPRDGEQDILLYDPHFCSHIIAAWNGTGWDDGNFQFTDNSFSHWMPLPEAPVAA